MQKSVFRNKKYTKLPEGYEQLNRSNFKWKLKKLLSEKCYYDVNDY